MWKFDYSELDGTLDSHWNRLPRGVVDVPSPEAFIIRLVENLRILKR